MNIGDRLFRFPGGLKLRHWKQMALSEQLQPCPLPTRLLLTVNAHQGEHAAPIVEPGDAISAGQLVADVPEGTFGARLHCPLQGTVTGISQRAVIGYPARLGQVIEVAVGDQPLERFSYPPLDSATLTPESVAERAFEAGIVGLGGALFPTHRKLLAPRPIDTLIVNGAECEPYIACDEMLMRHRARELITGCEIAGRATQASEIVLAIEDQMGKVEAILNEAVSAARSPVRIVKVPTIYPEGGERQLIQVLTGQEVPRGDIPPALGIAVLNVATVSALAAAVLEGQPLTHRIVSLTGRGIAKPQSFVVPIGTPVNHLIEASGGLTDSAARLVMGGPMMGVAIADLDVGITQATNALTALIRRDVDNPRPELACIRCMECHRVCPARLLPQQLLTSIRARRYDDARTIGLADCIECGCCDYVCPSQIPLVDHFRFAKAELKASDFEAAMASQAKQRFENRELRLEREQAARLARREEKRERLKSGDKKSEIMAAIARAKAAKKSSSSSPESVSAEPVSTNPDSADSDDAT